MFSSKFMKPALVTAAIVAAFAGGVFTANAKNAASPSTAAPGPIINQQKLPDFTVLVDHYGKAVVNISMVKKEHKEKINGLFNNIPDDQAEIFRRFGFPFFGGGERTVPEQRGTGSGFIISSDGLILTNAHVVSDADEIIVRLTDDREFKGKVLGYDEQTDIAVVKIDAKGLPVVRLGNSDNVKVGEWVAAIGSPFGLTNSVTAGIVSAKSRNIEENIVPFIQTDVAINPGNSGGPLFNMNGEVIGINSQIFSTSGGSMGLSFAIPINIASQVKDQIIKNGKVTRGRLGVMVQQLSPELAKSFGLPEETKGAVIAQIEANGPAANSGLKPGDIITAVNGEKIKSFSDVPRLISFTKPGTRIELTVLRDKKEIRIPVTIGSSTESAHAAKGSDSDDSQGAVKQESQGRLGVTVRPLTAKEAKRAGTSGLLIAQAEGAAAKAGIRPGDIIVSVNGTPVKTNGDLSKALKGRKQIALLIQRNKSRIFVPVELQAQ
ncbi:Do family serine endopeptidase [Mesosutterella sp. OilRF-GAM-744-9]|uniref:Probable periplasmic serine endoprotease DegP-like n=1 Tax=Mesosutterella porci TaxID=2915351 RepID=A0ABS9MNI7_9BURK|nr:Do family serine endopeptidase [Mesosutterella sp. oilRF-744-WT-GAM-9]MCG5030181.1 Do family serine endopeptidase [Mesosutterella sp. oilRF-744-WT-GAM-9]